MELPDKLYLETTIVERYFKRAILATKRGKKNFKRPFILDLVNQKGVELFTSSFVLAEVFEHMWKSYKATPSEIAKLTQRFLEEFSVFLILTFSVKPIILRWIRKRKLEAKDVIHLSISMQHKLPILSGDSDFSERGVSIYNKIIYDRELIQNLLSTPSNDSI